MILTGKLKDIEIPLIQRMEWNKKKPTMRETRSELMRVTKPKSNNKILKFTAPIPMEKKSIKSLTNASHIDQFRTQNALFIGE